MLCQTRPADLGLSALGLELDARCHGRKMGGEISICRCAILFGFRSINVHPGKPYIAAGRWVPFNLEASDEQACGDLRIA